MKTPDLEINNGYYVFRLVTEAVQFLQPADFPYGKNGEIVVFFSFDWFLSQGF